MDQTQLLDWDGESEAEDPSGGTGGVEESPKPVGRLHLLSSKYGPEKDFWVYPGKNVIGRLESCQICLPTSSVSKTHAVIEVPSPGGPHLLYDQESLNRTRCQRMVLIPHVRYSLQDGNMLLFGDVGCQYFMVGPERVPESPNDSLEVPPTQTRTESQALVIEETPAPRRKMGFGGLLVQDSDREEEDEEVVNGAGRSMYLSVANGCESSTRHGARGHGSVAPSMFFSPSAAVVPESDEESGELSDGGPSLCLRYEGDEAEPCSLANGTVAPSNQERYPVRPGSTEAETLSDSGEKPVAEGLDASTDPSLSGFHLDSDTDVEDEEETGTTSDQPAVKDDFVLELGSDTDADEPLVVNPDTGSSDSPQLANNADSDTDIEDSEENLSVLSLEAWRVTHNGDSDTDAEGTIVSPGVASVESHESGLQSEDSGSAEERAGGSSGGHRPRNGADFDMHVEAGGNPDTGLTAQPPEGDDTDVEEPPLGAEGALQAGEASGDSDTDVEVADQEPEKLGGIRLPSPPPTRRKGKDAAVEETKAIGLQGSSTRAEDVTEIKNTCVEPPKDYGPSGEQSVDPDRREHVANAEVVEKLTSVPQDQHLLALSVDSDTDVEEVGENANESSAGNDKGTSDGLRGGNRGSGFVDLEDRDSDTDVEVTAPSPKNHLAHDSDTDVEEMTVALPGKPVEGQGSPLVPVRALVDGEETAGSAPKQSVFRDACEEEENTDAEGNKSHSEDESNTGDEADSDMAVQATQCYLPTATSSPNVEEASGMTDSSCAVEEEATQAFAFQTPLKPAKFQAGTGFCSSWTEDDPDAYMVVATQPFFKEASTLSEEPTQAFIVKEEEGAELGSRHPLEGEDLSEMATQPAIPISAIKGEQESGSVQEDATKPHSLETSCLEPRSQPAGAAGVEELYKGKEIQTVHSVQVPPLAPPQVEKACGSTEQASVVSPEPEVAPELSQPRGGAGCIEGEAQERHSEPSGEVRDAEQRPKHATDKPSKPVAPVSERRRSLRSSAATSPSPLSERGSGRRGQRLKHATDKPSKPVAPVSERRRSLRSSAATSPSPLSERGSGRRGQIGSAGMDGSSEPVAPLSRRRGLRQLSKPTQYMGEPERKAEEPKVEETSRRKTPSKREPAVTTCQAGPRRSQRRSNSSKFQEETRRTVSSPGTKKSTGPRKRQATAAKAVEEQQPEPRRTRSSRQSGGTPEMTPAPEDCRKGNKVGQEPAQSTPPSGRRSQQQSTKIKPAATTRNRSQSSAPAVGAPKVLFTGVIDEEGERVVTELGGSLAQSVFDCTHLVTDRVRRTVKFLCALARGIPIVTLDWLEKSKRNSFFLVPTSFLVFDPEQEKNFQFSLAESLQKARQEGGLLQGYELHVTPNVKPEPEHMRDIIKCSGGTFLPRMPRAYKDKRVVISCPEDLPRCKPAQEAKVPLADAEFILTGILQQKANLDAYRLDGEGAPSPASPAAASTRASKRRAAAFTTPAPPSTAKRRR